MSRLKNTLRGLAMLGSIRARLEALADATAEATRVANEARDMARSALEMAEAAHHAIEDADPREAMAIVTAVRDEVRTMTLEVTTSLNSLSAELTGRGLSAELPSQGPSAELPAQG